MVTTDDLNTPARKGNKVAAEGDLEEKILMEQTLVNERRFAPGEQAPSARARTPAERDRERARHHEAPGEPEVPPMETPDVERIAKQSATGTEKKRES
ncbi:MAG TPA: hypothetical protein VNZ52_10490 [Candidatus Thermoplasmatota archaeon]|nr:hypothetical protein [Candidatus Thermoplasmatota archaeon]